MKVNVSLTQTPILTQQIPGSDPSLMCSLDTRMRNSLLQILYFTSITGESHLLKLSHIFLTQLYFILFYCNCSLEDFFFGT